jgi:hypothetical protein
MHIAHRTSHVAYSTLYIDLDLAILKNKILKIKIIDKLII